MAPKLNLLPQHLPKGIADRIGRTVGGVGITPNMISLVGFAGNVLAAWLIVEEQLIAAGIVFLVFSALDFVDGAVARATNTASDYGAVFDAVLDRCGEAVTLTGIAWYFGERGEYVQAGLTYAALLGSILVSYTRARADVNGLVMREGIFRRQERVVIITLGLWFNALTVMIWILAVLTNITALQRFWLMMGILREMDAEERKAKTLV